MLHVYLHANPFYGPNLKCYSELSIVLYSASYRQIQIYRIKWECNPRGPTAPARGGRYYRKKLSTADISEFFKLSANYRYRILGIWELSKNYQYRKLHPILSDKHN